MSYYGDITLEDTCNVLFTTRAFATGIPGTLSAATVAVYEDGTSTPIETGVLVTEDLNSIVGLNMVPIVAAAGSGYQVGANYHVVIEAGTVDSVSVVGEVVGNFSVGRSAAYERLGAPAGASVSADVADIPTVAEFNARTLVAASYFDPAADTVVNVTNLATYTGNTKQTADHTAGIADIPTVAEFNARTIASASYFDPAADTVALVTDVTTKTGYSLSTAGILAIWHQLTAAVVTASTIGKLIVDNLNATVSSRMATTHLAATAGKLDGVALADTTTTNTDMLTAAAVNAEVVDVVNVDTITLPGQVAPPLAPTQREAIGWLYKVLRNRKDQTSILWQLYADDQSTVDAKATVSDDSTTAIKQEIITGP